MNFIGPIKNKADIEKVKMTLKEYFDPRDYFLFTLGINTGMNVGELLKLKVKNVKKNKNVKEDTLNIEWKSSYKDFPITIDLRKEINKYIKFMSDEDYLFLSKKDNNNPLCVDSVGLILRKAGKKVDIRVSGITLRKTFGYQYYKRTKDITFLKKLFNHPSNAYTLRFIEVDNYAKETIEFL